MVAGGPGRALFTAGALIVAAALATGCSSGKNACAHGRQVACACAGGEQGVQVCSAEGTFGPCSACGATDGGADGGIDGGSLPGQSFDTAIPISAAFPPTPTAGTLDGASTRAFYQLRLHQGDRLEIWTQTAAANASTAAPSVIDTVVTMWNSARQPIAQDDDGWPRSSTDSQLYLRVPADGDYYVTVEDCNSAFGAGSLACAPPAGITDLNYALFVVPITLREANAATSQDGTITHAQGLAYQLYTGGGAGDYGSYIIDGTLGSATDTHVFSFRPPADTSVGPAQRARAEFWLQPVGAVDGDGSTANVKLWVTDATGAKTLARADQSNYGSGDNGANGPLDLSVPVVPGQQYYLFVQATGATSGRPTDYYFVQHFVGSWHYGQQENEGPTATGLNDVSASSELLVTPSTASPGRFFVDGNLSQPGDVDWYEVDPPANTDSAELGCQSARAGSGVVGLTATLFDSAGTSALGGVGPESRTADLYAYSVPVPAGTTRALLRVTASSQDATNTGSYYLCAVSYYSSGAPVDGGSPDDGGTDAGSGSVCDPDGGLATGHSWSSKAALPTALAGPAGASVGGKLYVFGGRNGGSISASNATQIYSPATDSWSSGAAMPTARWGAAAVAINGLIYVIGGSGPNGAPIYSKLEVYDPAANTWDTTRPDMPTARTAPAAAAVNGVLYVIGGQNGLLLTTVEAFDPATNQWTTRAAMPTARHSMAADVVNGHLYVVGGHALAPVKTVEAYDPVANQWTGKADLSVARESPVAAVVDGVLHVVSGWDGTAPTATVEVYDPAANAWCARPSLPTARYAEAAGVAGGVLYVAGGEDATGASGALTAY